VKLEDTSDNSEISEDEGPRAEGKPAVERSQGNVVDGSIQVPEDDSMVAAQDARSLREPSKRSLDGEEHDTSSKKTKIVIPELGSANQTTKRRGRNQLVRTDVVSNHILTIMISFLTRLTDAS